MWFGVWCRRWLGRCRVVAAAANACELAEAGDDLFGGVGGWLTPVDGCERSAEQAGALIAPGVGECLQDQVVLPVKDSALLGGELHPPACPPVDEFLLVTVGLAL